MGGRPLRFGCLSADVDDIPAGQGLADPRRPLRLPHISDMPRADDVPSAVVLAGPHKSASTHLQYFLVRNRAVLDSLGWHWPAAPLLQEPASPKGFAVVARALLNQSCTSGGVASSDSWWATRLPPRCTGERHETAAVDRVPAERVLAALEQSIGAAASGGRLRPILASEELDVLGSDALSEPVRRAAFARLHALLLPSPPVSSPGRVDVVLVLRRPHVEHLRSGWRATLAHRTRTSHTQPGGNLPVCPPTALCAPHTLHRSEWVADHDRSAQTSEQGRPLLLAFATTAMRWALGARASDAFAPWVCAQLGAPFARPAAASVRRGGLGVSRRHHGRRTQQHSQDVGRAAARLPWFDPLHLAVRFAASGLFTVYAQRAAPPPHTLFSHISRPPI
jgi:hypothetical protein